MADRILKWIILFASHFLSVKVIQETLLLKSDNFKQTTCNDHVKRYIYQMKKRHELERRLLCIFSNTKHCFKQRHTYF